MIIRQTTTIVFEYPQDYLQEQEWCKTKEDRWVHKSTDTLGAVYENQISYSIGASADRKTENNSEKPNNCEKDCFLCKWLGDVDVCGRCRNRNLFAEADTEPTISRMEQVEDEPQTCDNCKLKGSTKWCNNQVVCRAYKPMDEPQTEPLHTCSVNGRPYDCGNCEYHKCTADEPQTEREGE